MNSFKLACQYRFRLLIEKLKIRAVMSFYSIKKLFFWMTLGKLLMVTSVSLITCIAVFLYRRIDLGLDFPYLALNNVEQLDKLGQIGDFFGGILNPLLSFMALLGVLYTIRIQGLELKEAREENKLANKIQDKQTAVFERQNFESVLFRLIDVHGRITDRIHSFKGIHGIGFAGLVESVVQDFHFQVEERDQRFESVFMSGDALHDSFMKQIEKDRESRCLVAAAENGTEAQGQILLSQYFRNLYQILKLIDSFKTYSVDESTEHRRSKRVRLEYFERRQYCNIVRAQLSEDELRMLFFNCIAKSGAGLKHYVEKYSFLKHLNRSMFFKGYLHFSDMYNPMAYADYENISTVEIMDIEAAAGRAKVRHILAGNQSV